MGKRYNILELKAKSGMDDKAFWEGIKNGIKKGWFVRDGMEIEVIDPNPPIGADEIFLMALDRLGPGWHSEDDINACMKRIVEEMTESCSLKEDEPTTTPGEG